MPACGRGTERSRDARDGGSRGDWQPRLNRVDVPCYLHAQSTCEQLRLNSALKPLITKQAPIEVLDTRS
jgi:hypothetical protein